MPYPMTAKTLAEFEEGVRPPVRRCARRRLVLAVAGALARGGWVLDRASVRVLDLLPEHAASGRRPE